MRYLLIIILLLISLKTYCQQDSIMAKANAKLGKTMQYFPKLKQGNFNYSNTCFEIAEIYAIKKQKDSAFYYLNLALHTCPATDKACKEVYYPNVLSSFHYRQWANTPEWKKFESEVLTGFKTANSELKRKDIAIELAKAEGIDQSLRFYCMIYRDKEAGKLMRGIDSQNMKTLKRIIAETGFPKISDVGKDAASAAFLISQHADDDIAFQKQVLNMITELCKQNEVNKQNVAYLTDRIMIKERGTQLYGTQMKGNKPFPIVDSDMVDHRRKQMGLTPLAEYLELYNFTNSK